MAVGPVSGVPWPSPLPCWAVRGRGEAYGVDCVSDVVVGVLLSPVACKILLPCLLPRPLRQVVTPDPAVFARFPVFVCEAVEDSVAVGVGRW